MSNINHNSKTIISIPAALQTEYNQSKGKKTLLLARHFDQNSPFHKDKMPKDILTREIGKHIKPKEWGHSPMPSITVENNSEAVAQAQLNFLQDIKIDIEKEFAAAVNIFNNCADGIELKTAQEYFAKQFGIDLTQEISNEQKANLICKIIDYLGKKPSEIKGEDQKIISYIFPHAWNGFENNRDSRGGVNFLDGNLKLIPSNLFKCKNIKSISIPCNKLTALPAEIGELENLEDLDLYNNKLSTIPEEVKNLKNLKKLDLQENPLLYRPDFLNNLEKNASIFTDQNIPTEKEYRQKQLGNKN